MNYLRRLHTHSLMALVIVLFCLLNLSCSVYQSEGRAFLQEEALDFALQGASLNANRRLKNCAQIEQIDEHALSAHWTFEMPSDSLEVWAWNGEELSVLTHKQDESASFVCAFLYPNQEQMLKQMTADLKDAQETTSQLIKTSH